MTTMIQLGNIPEMSGELFFYISITFSKVELWNSNKKDVKRLEYEEEEKEEEEGKTI